MNAPNDVVKTLLEGCRWDAVEGIEAVVAESNETPTTDTPVTENEQFNVNYQGDGFYADENDEAFFVCEETNMVYPVFVDSDNQTHIQMADKSFAPITESDDGFLIDDNNCINEGLERGYLISESEES